MDKQKTAHEFLREWLKGWETQEWYEAIFYLAEERYKNYRRMFYIRVVPLMALVALALLGGCFGVIRLWLSFALMLAFGLLGRKSNTNAYRSYNSILTRDCDARQAVIAFLLLAEKGVGLRLGDSFQADYMTATALYASGYEQIAIEFMELVYEQLPKRRQESATVFLYYRNLRLKCLRHLGRIQAAAQEKNAIADYVAAHPKCQNSAWYRQYCELERIYDGLALRDFHNIRKNAESFLAKAGSNYNRVTGHYLMYCIEKGIGNSQGAQEHAEYILNNGGGLALAKEVSG